MGAERSRRWEPKRLGPAPGVPPLIPPAVAAPRPLSREACACAVGGASEGCWTTAGEGSRWGHSVPFQGVLIFLAVLESPTPCGVRPP